MISSDKMLNFTILSLIANILSVIGLSGILGSLLILGFSFNISAKLNLNMFVKIITYYGAYSMLVYVFHMPTFTIFKKVAVSINIDHSYTKQFILFFPGIVLPLVYGKLLSCNKILYKILIGRNL